MRDQQQAEKAAYAEKLASQDDDAFVKEVADKCWFSAFASNNPRSKYHWMADACFDEAKRREKPWLYNRGWNAAYRLAGHEPSEQDIAAAKEGK